MEKKELKFSEDVVSRCCFFCREPSVGVVEGESGNFHYKLPYCLFHKKAVKKILLEQIEENRRRTIPINA